MKKIITWMTVILLPSGLLFTVSSCQKEAVSKTGEFENEPQTQTASQVKFVIPDLIPFEPAAFYPEGVAWDKFSNRFLVSSFASGTIGSVTPDGEYTPFIHDEDVHSTLGLHIDEARKRVVVAITDGLFSNVAKVGVYDLQTGGRIHLVDLAALRPGVKHLADDLAIDPQGNIYITDVKAPVVYKVDVNGHASVFFENEKYAEPPGVPFYWVGFNGIVYNNNGFLIVAFYSGGSLVKIPINDPASYSEVQLDTPITSADGLLMSRDGKELVIVDNKYLTYPPEIVRMTSNDKWTTARRMESFPTGFTSPTTATSDGKNVFVMNSYLYDIFFGIPFANTKYSIQKIHFNANEF